MTKEKQNKLDNLLNEFLEAFPVESLKTMELTQYTDVVEKDKLNNSFTYWVETKLRELGSIKGGCSEKFGIYKYNKEPTNDGMDYDNTYAWYKKFGTKDEAWKIIRDNVYKIAKLSSEEKFTEIDDITDLWPGYKWKIAFLYSNKKIINTFTYDALLFLSKQYGHDFSKKTKYSELYAFLITQKPENEDFWSFGEKLWESWNKSDEIFSTVLHELKDFYDTDSTFHYVENEIDCINDSSNHFIWIKTNDNSIGNDLCHYEFIFYNRQLYTEIHFEDENVENFAKICYSLGLKHHPRHKNRFCVEHNEIDIDAIDDYIEKADSELRKLDLIVGKEIREEIQKMSGKSKSVLECKNLLLNNYNIILHGAPGTGKTYLAKQIAKEMGCTDEEIGFVQFHPSYDYTDFVEGLRPDCDEKDNVIFTRQDGIFKKFCKKAVNNIINMKKTENELQQELSTKEILDNFFSQAIAEQREFKTISNISFFVKSYNESHIHIMYKSLDNTYKDVEKIKYSDFVSLYNNHKRIERSDVKTIVNRQVERQADSYSSVLTNIIKLDRIFELIKKWKEENREFELETGSDHKYIYKITDVSYDEIIINTRAWNNAPIEKTQHNFDPFLLLYPELLDTLEKDDYIHYYINDLNQQIRKTLDNNMNQNTITKPREKQYVFIIDEINRGELSKIFGELFFCIDPGYRGLNGIVKTQYQNLIQDDDEFYKGFYIPENVYIIGTMNDIDRSVESMDFAMRRRFIFEEVTAEDSAENMNLSETAKEIMIRINNHIEQTEGLNDSYKIGGAYFLNATDFDKLWRIKLSPLIKEYLRGIDDDGSKFDKIQDAYFGNIDNDSSEEDEITPSVD